MVDIEPKRLLRHSGGCDQCLTAVPVSKVPWWDCLFAWRKLVLATQGSQKQIISTKAGVGRPLLASGVSAARDPSHE